MWVVIKQILLEIRIISYSSYQTHPACLGVALAETDCPSLFDENYESYSKEKEHKKSKKQYKKKKFIFSFNSLSFLSRR